MTVPSKCISIDTDLLFLTQLAVVVGQLVIHFCYYVNYLGYLSPQDIKVALDLHFKVDLRLSELLGSVVK